MSNIYFISSRDCSDCARMRSCLFDCLQKLDPLRTLQLTEIDSEQDEAIKIAVNKKIYDLPGCSIGDISIYGKDFKENDVYNAIEGLFRKQTKN